MFEVLGPALVAALAARPAAELDDADLVESIAAADRLIAWATAEQSERIVELAHRRLDPGEPGAGSSHGTTGSTSSASTRSRWLCG